MSLSYVVNTGDQHPVYERMEKFFLEIREKIGGHPMHWRIERGGHCIGQGKNHADLDDRTHMLFYKTDILVAAVIETRTEANFMRFDFFDNSDAVLNPKYHSQQPYLPGLEPQANFQ